MSTLEDNGITDYDHDARRVCLLLSSPHPRPRTRNQLTSFIVYIQFMSIDLEKFDYIFAMDRSNLSDLQRLQRGNSDAKAKVMLFGEFSGNGKAEIVQDPYYGGRDGFDKAYEQCFRFSKNFLKEMFGDEEKQ